MDILTQRNAALVEQAAAAAVARRADWAVKSGSLCVCGSGPTTLAVQAGPPEEAPVLDTGQTVQPV